MKKSRRSRPPAHAKSCRARWRAIGLLLLTGLSAVGCSSSNRPAQAPVSGIITWNGSPVEGASVMFMPGSAGRPATGVTDAEGRYQLTTFEKGDGAIVGHHTVTISKTVPLNDQPYAPQKTVIPFKYGNLATSGCEATVDAKGPNTFNFDMVGEAK